MRQPEADRKKDRTTLLLCGLLVLGAALRIMACFWGYPYELHPDESTIVSNAIKMISRHTYLADVYNRPDHFEIKCCVVLFQIFSYFRYLVRADIAFPADRISFFLIARMYTAFFGVLTIGLTYRIVEKIRPRAKLMAAGLAAFYPIFVQHSAYATPDVVLAFFVLLAAYLSILYLENSSIKYLTLMCVVTGIGITIKYTCAIACIWIAVVVCIDCVRKKKYLDIVRLGIFSIAVVFAACFLLAPNLFTNLTRTVETLRLEARSTHLGADGLGFFGNFLYYLKTFLDAAGYEALIVISIGALYCLKNRNPGTLSMGMGLLFWVCTSVLSLHWERWGMPIYVFFVALEAVGISWLFDLAGKKWLKAIAAVLGSVIVLNSVVSGLLVVQKKLTTEARVDAIQFCEQTGITKENTWYDGYTPFNTGGPGTINATFDEEGKIVAPPGVEYLIISGGMYDRYYAEPERYSDQVDMYDNIQNKHQLIYHAGGDYYDHSGIGLINIAQAIKGLASHNSDTVCGYVIKIYRISEEERAEGKDLEFGDFELTYLGGEHTVLEENNHTLKLLMTAKEPEKTYFNSNKYKIAYHLYDKNGNLVNFDGPRTDFGFFKGSTEIDMQVDVSEKGSYILEVDVVQENVAWLSQLGMPTKRIEVEVR